MKQTENKPSLPFNIAVLGPTGSGKTSVSHCLADNYNADIVSCDSMQVYRQMNIGTDKPSIEELQKYRYHLIDFLDIHQSWNLQDFLDLARPLIRELNQNNRKVILTGGTGLYAKALLYDYKPHPADNQLYTEIYAQTDTQAGCQALLREVMQNTACDETLLKKLQNNPRRLARAVEIIRLQGKLPQNFLTMNKQKEKALFGNFIQFILLPAPEEHRTAIHSRVKKMLRQGWLKETNTLLTRGLLNTPTARQVIGYPEIADYIQGRIRDHHELIEKITRKTWQYARRQKTWFRNQHPHACLITYRPHIETHQICAAITDHLNKLSTSTMH